MNLSAAPPRRPQGTITMLLTDDDPRLEELRQHPDVQLSGPEQQEEFTFWDCTMPNELCQEFRGVVRGVLTDLDRRAGTATIKLDELPKPWSWRPLVVGRRVTIYPREK